MNSNLNLDNEENSMNKKKTILLVVILLSIIGIIYTCVDSKNRVYNTTDIELPYVEKSEPVSRDRFIEVDSEMQIYFNEHMDKSTIRKENILLKNESNETIDYDLNYENKIATIIPIGKLNYNSKYTIEVLSNCKDNSGNKLEMPFKGEFKTSPKYIPIIQTGQDKSYKDFDDGYYKAGYVRNFSRDNFNNIVEDQYTGHQWQDDESVYSEKKGFDEAKEYCDDLEYAGYSDWRLPEVTALFGTLNFRSKPKFLNNIEDLMFWGSDSNGTPYIVSDTIPVLSNNVEKTKKINIRCLRGKNIESAGFMYHNVENQKMTWAKAIQYCEDLTVGQFNDWRLPNINELINATKNNQWDYEGQKSFISSTLFESNNRKSYMEVYTDEGKVEIKSSGLDFKNNIMCFRNMD